MYYLYVTAWPVLISAGERASSADGIAQTLARQPGKVI